MAIAFDSSAIGSVTGSMSLNFSHTCTGANRLLFVGVQGALADDITGVTYAGSAMTLIIKDNVGGTNQFNYLFYLIAPSTGTNNVVVSSSVGINIAADSVSYTGASQSGVPDASVINSGSTVNTLTTSLTTVANNCWTVLSALNGNSLTISAGSGSTLRQHQSLLGIFDSNGAKTPAGSTSMTVTSSSPGQFSGLMASFSPFVAPVINSNFLSFM